MRWLNDDRGASGVFVAITMVVTIGMTGFAVDTGALYQERRQLSNGADAAVLAIAEDCALEVGSCDTGTAKATAISYASQNAADGYAGVDEVVLDTAARSVRVVTSTLTDEGGVVFEPFFARVVGFEGTTVRASATAIWGYPRSLQGLLPLIISDCEFPDGGSFPTPPTVLYFHDGNNAEPCNAQAGQDADGDGFLAGGFGWLSTTGLCEVSLAVGVWSTADPGSSPSTGCDPGHLTGLLTRPIALPFFDDIEGVGGGGRYHVAGFGMFQITGYNFGGQFKHNPPCTGDERCVSGFFTTGTVPDGEVGGENRGVVVVKLTG